MTMKLKFVFALLVVGGSLGLRAQVSIAPVQFPLDSKEEAPLRNNLMVVGMGVSTDVEDGNGAAGGGYNARYSLRSHLGASVVRPRWTSELKYWPQFSYYTRAAGYKNVAQAFGADLKYRLSKRLELNLRNSLTYTSDTFDAVAANALVSESPIL